MSGTRAGAETGERAGWTVLDVMRRSGEYLSERGVPRGRLDAEHLLAHALGTRRLQLYLDFERPLEPVELERYRPLVRRRGRREPLQYILGTAPFRELELVVDGRVLVPRPETEVLVEEVLAWARATGRAGLDAVDVGTGSGAVALALWREGPFRRIVATDVSEAALDVARRNAAELDAEGAVELLGGSLFEPLPPGGRFDVVVSNPPYVTDDELAGLEPEVRSWEPAEALRGGPDGLAVIRPLVEAAVRHLRPGGLLAFEVGVGQAAAAVRVVERVGVYEDVRVRRDLAGRERVVLARVPTTAGAR